MTTSDTDIFGAYECLRNDKTQKRFISVLDQIRQIIIQQAQTQSMNILPFPSAKVYLVATCLLLDERLEKKNYDGLPELLRCLHIELESSTIDTSIASKLLGYLLPLFDSASVDLAISLCPVCVQLVQHTSSNDAMLKQLITGLCTNTLHDDSRLRKAASQALYDFPQIQEHAFNFMFEIASQNPLRALQIAKNLAPIVPGPILSRHFQEFLEFSESPNRSVRAKAMQIIAVALHYLPVESVLNTVKRFTAKIPDAPGDVLLATTELIQSAITMLVHKDLPVLKLNFSQFLHSLILFLTVGDKEADPTINSTILYGIHAVILDVVIPPGTDPITVVSEADRNCISSIVTELTNSLTIQFISIWSHIYKILEVIPTMLKSTTFMFLQAPLLSSLEKINNADTKNPELITSFIVACAVEMGLRDFFEKTLIPPNDLSLYETLVLPVLTAYNGKRCYDDLLFTIDMLMPVEEMLRDNLQDDNSRRTWHRVWNALPNCVTTSKKFIDSNPDAFYHFIDTICSVFEQHKELCRSFCRIIQALGPLLSECDNVLVVLSNAAVDSSTSSCVIPAIASVCKGKSQEFINGFFTKLVADKIIPLASNPDQINIACALIDIVIALLPFLTPENLGLFYNVLLSFVQAKNHLQKKGLRTLKVMFQTHKMTQNISETMGQLINVLNQTKGVMSSSTFRYRLLLMSTLLQMPNDVADENLRTEMYNTMIGNFIPEFVEALKDSGAKTREAGVECINAVADEFVKRNLPLSTLLAPLSISLTANVSTLVSAAIEAINLIVKKYYDKIDVETLAKISLEIFKSPDSETGTEISRSALSYASTLIKKTPKFVEESQLPNVLLLSIKSIKKTNWEIKGKGRRIIDRCIDNFGIDLVTKAFPQGEEKLLRGARKEHNRETRKKDENEKNKENNKQDENKIELDQRFDLDVRDLNDPRETITHIETPEQVQENDLEFDKRGRLVLKEAPKKKTRADKENDEDEDEDRGNEVQNHIRQKRQIQKQQEMKKQRDQFITETGSRFRAPKGKGDRQKDGQVPYSFAPLTSKNVNKRYRGQMKAAYKKLFKSNK
ncbi:hypothetical protein TRFO_01876 [Tritrichomonas foetus]|uniref:Ribosomal RNA-processing protein 12-like conserved domain-containing protein n=1 Tax=Tritrichomonas foetus TaxID=1144522 RepID=A0A1J4JKA1_9EUKA|nr:hypothetical protein TRFO_01876 [Tritrichomonas foetus]|eukprot:OHS98815.1 hypothetical protein TRFO_01876 [Tritrichomonas foetus]